MVSFVILCFILNIYKTFIWYGNYISIKLFKRERKEEKKVGREGEGGRETTQRLGQSSL